MNGLSTTDKGRAGEDRAVQALEREGYVVLARNVRAGRGEIDVVATDGSVLCFVEVRRREKIEDAMASVNGKKQHQVVKAARAYLSKLAEVPSCRFDVVVVAGDRVELFKAAFEAPSEITR